MVDGVKIKISVRLRLSMMSAQDLASRSSHAACGSCRQIT
jgi:hypothetical protein